jgi:hypothetical protein
MLRAPRLVRSTFLSAQGAAVFCLKSTFAALFLRLRSRTVTARLRFKPKGILRHGLKASGASYATLKRKGRRAFDVRRLFALFVRVV